MFLRGRETAAPSGKFCKPIPSAKANAALNVTPLSPTEKAPNVTPTAKPSGIL
nr:hypothetical protein [Brachyspira hyodysenteriae]